MRFLLHVFLIVLLTLVTQLGGVAWAVALAFRRRLPAFVICYVVLSLAAIPAAGLGGRVPLPCLGDALRSHPVTCLLNRHYVAPELREVAKDLAADLAQAHPGSVTVTLDGGFPFAGLPLLPHLSHGDGRKLDLALPWQDTAGRYRPGRSKSPLGYFGFADGPDACAGGAGWLRWNMGTLNRFLPNWRADTARLRATLVWLARDGRVGKVLIEPHIRAHLGLAHPKLRFQGCNAARHDDHIHLQL